MLISRFLNKALVLCVVAFSLASCSGLQTQPGRSVVEKGHASWYGKRFQGRKTASGEFFDADKLTAAHPTLPFGTFVEVRSLSSGRSVTVKINDRGPSSHSRIIDLSHAAAAQLGFVGKGEDLVEILL